MVLRLTYMWRLTDLVPSMYKQSRTDKRVIALFVTLVSVWITILGVQKSEPVVVIFAAASAINAQRFIRNPDL